MNRIASDEPDQVGIVPQVITFWHRGQSFTAAVSSSMAAGRMVKDYGVDTWHPLRGDFGRAWLADACSMVLHESLHAQRINETAAAAQARADRRKAKAALLEAEAQARRTKTARW